MLFLQLIFKIIILSGICFQKFNSLFDDLEFSDPCYNLKYIPTEKLAYETLNKQDYFNKLQEHLKSFPNRSEVICSKYIIMVIINIQIVLTEKTYHKSPTIKMLETDRIRISMLGDSITEEIEQSMENFLRNVAEWESR